MIVDGQSDGSGSRALAWAALGGHDEIVTLLLSAEADVDKVCLLILVKPLWCFCYCCRRICEFQSDWALRMACQSQHVSAAVLLIQAGAQVNTILTTQFDNIHTLNVECDQTSNVIFFSGW